MPEIKINSIKSIITTKGDKPNVETDVPLATANALQNIAKANSAKTKLKAYVNIIRNS